MGARAEYTNTAYGSERMGPPAQQGASRPFRPGASGVVRPFAPAHSFLQQQPLYGHNGCCVRYSGVM
jgi:hypothetical protein